jgi:phosphatidylinositol 3-kinase
MSIIKLMKHILEETMGIDLHVVTYNIQPVSLKSGFIGAVSNSHTIYTIEEKFKITLSNYIKKHNPETSSKELTERFLRSCAFYSVVTFLLGIGDRHLDNIMVTERGEIFHIDYGFVLGKDPKPMNTPSMRISEGMLDAIGGYHSESYIEFKDLCYRIYDILRRHVNTFVCILSLLPKQNTGKSRTNPKITDKRLLREIVKRFAPGETYQQAKTLLHTKIDKSTNVTSFSKYHVIDFFHRHNKEKTFKNAISYTLNTTISGTRSALSGTKTVIQGIWDYISK